MFIGHRIMHAYANFVGYDVTNITFRTFQWYKSRYNDAPDLPILRAKVWPARLGMRYPTLLLDRNQLEVESLTLS